MRLITTKPLEEIKKYAQKHDKNPDSLDYEIVSYSTDIVFSKDKSKHYEGDEVSEFLDDALFLQDFKIVQNYEINIVNKTQSLVDFKIAANSSLTKIVANFKAFCFDYDLLDDVALKYIQNAINKKFINSGLYLGLRQKKTNAILMQMIKDFKDEKIEEKNIILALGVDAIDSNDPELKLYYKEKKENQENIDYSKRGFVSAVNGGDLIIEFVKSIEAKDGKNLKCESIKAKRSNLKNEPDFKISENISQMENDKSIKYYANANGYVYFSNNTYDIKDSIDIKKITFKTTGSIEAGVNKDVTLNVFEADYLKDAIGPNLSIEASIVNVKGCVAQHSTINAQDVTIGAQTHSKSKIFAKKISINSHRGYCKGDEIFIERLENGVVEGKIVRINQCLGGKVIANKVYVQTLTTNTMFEISDLAVITNCIGENNKFLITANSSPIIAKSLTQNAEKLKENNDLLKNLPKLIQSKLAIINSNKESIIQIKQRIAQMQESNTPIPAAFFNKLKEFQNISQEYNDLKEQFNDANEKKKYILDEFAILQDKVFDARVINLNTWANLNEIRFKLTQPKIELSYNTSKDEKIYCIKLEKDPSIDDEEKSIKIVKIENNQGSEDDSLY
ncbi:flagellar assembly protein A [Campylobacter canadensis]|uniref:flagellar assembly protein A n=1 Tax=Campylobacter canadensis TaxID=449520 RepID=UPI001CCBE3D4|nr:flagellar assembly protein A [Campylobacter canadensis]MBZ8001445.1 DUF342 domain-containing protein [Campylobacter canadensis]